MKRSNFECYCRVDNNSTVQTMIALRSSNIVASCKAIQLRTTDRVRLVDRLLLDLGVGTNENDSRRGAGDDIEKRDMEEATDPTARSEPGVGIPEVGVPLPNLKLGGRLEVAAPKAVAF